VIKEMDMNDLKSRSAIGGRSRLVTAALLILALALPCAAQQSATVFLKNGGQAQGSVRYLAASRSFEVKTDRGITQTLRAADVERVAVAQPPAGLQQALAAVNSGNYQAAIQPLSQIVSAYTMLGPDVVAGQALALAYLRTNRTKDALKFCEDLLKNNPDSLKSGAFASVYSEVLLAEGRIASLRTVLRTMVETGSREVAAVAQVRRGDLEMQEKKPREALLDGYLRTILLFQDVTFIQPEALYKAIKAHEALNEVQYAERWRKRLLGSFGTSEFAAKIK